MEDAQIVQEAIVFVVGTQKFATVVAWTVAACTAVVRTALGPVAWCLLEAAFPACVERIRGHKASGETVVFKRLPC